MNIYQLEIDAGISDQIAKSVSSKIQANFKVCDKPTNSLSPQESLDKVIDLINRNSKEDFTAASLNDNDLIFLTSILVSTGWNLNDDIFLAEELIPAVGSPVHKPINIDHDEKVIIGHMIESSIVDKEGKIIEDVSKATNFDLEVRGVLYKFLQYIQADIAEIVEKAKSGEMFVSMECLFNNFDYGFTTGSDIIKVVERNKNTAGLSKHLRVYGGEGTYEGFKIGRVLRNINFIGKGIVKNPANPDSVIKNIASAGNNQDILGVQKDSTETQNNGETSDMTKTIEQIQAELDVATKQLAEKTAELTKAAQDKVALEAKVISVEADLATVRTQAEEYVKSIEASNAAYKAMEAECSELKNKLDTTANQLNEAQAKLSEIEKAKVGQARFAKLSEVKKIDEKDKDTTIAELVAMTEEVFATVLKYATTDAVKVEATVTETEEVKDEIDTDEDILDGLTEEIGNPVVKAGVQDNSEINNVALATARTLLNRSGK